MGVGLAGPSTVESYSLLQAGQLNMGFSSLCFSGRDSRSPIAGMELYVGQISPSPKETLEAAMVPTGCRSSHFGTAAPLGPGQTRIEL